MLFKFMFMVRVMNWVRVKVRVFGDMVRVVVAQWAED